MPSLFYAGQPDYIEKLNTLATAASMTNGTVAASFLSLAVTGTATAASFVGPLTGNASTATTLATARNINGVSFNGSADITVTAAAGTLTGATLAAGVTASSLTSVGTLTALTVSGQASFAAGTAAAPSVKVGGEQNGLYSDGAGSLSFATAGARVVRMGTVGGTRNYLRLDANNTPLITAVAGATNADIGLASAGTGAILLATNGNIATTQVRVSHGASAVNYWDFTGAATGGGIRVDATGSDSGVNGFFVAKGSGVWNFCTSGSASNRQFQIGHIASAVNYIQATGAATGNAPSFAVGGSDANVSFAYYTKGTGTHQFFANNGLQMLVGATASSVNYWQFFGAAAAGALNMYADGADTNIAVVQNTKGTGSHFFRTNGGAQTQLEVAHTANAVNYMSVTGAATANSVRIDFTGSDSGVGAAFVAKGSGVFNFSTSAASSNRQFQIAHTASAVNYLQATGAAIGNAVTISAQGSDSNIDFAITPKGTGNVRFGTHSAIAAETVTGYITIKDSAGNTRKLAVLS